MPKKKGVAEAREGRLKNDVPRHDDFRNHFSKCLPLPRGGVGGWRVDTDEQGRRVDGGRRGVVNPRGEGWQDGGAR